VQLSIFLLLLQSANAKIAICKNNNFIWIKMKKLSFLLIFFCATTFISAQNAVVQTIKGDSNYYVLIETSYGNMTVKLYNSTPLHRDNFLKLVRKGFYDGLFFHRVINQFMIQGGDPDSRTAKSGQLLGNGGLGYTVPAEFVPGLYHKKGALAAARMGDNVNPQKASSSCQFYIVQGQVWNDAGLQMIQDRFGKKFTQEQIETYKTIGGTPHLDGDYTVFGEVVEGLDVIDKIAAVPCGANDRPVEDVKMKISIIELK